MRKRKAMVSDDYCWVRCVADHPHSEAAHGDVVGVQSCICGARRLVEVNGCHRVVGEREEPEMEPGPGERLPRTEAIGRATREGAPLIPLREFARRLGVHSVTARRWAEAGLIPGAIKTPGGHWRVPAPAM